MKQAFDSIIICWPNYDSSFADDILKTMHIGQELIYIGEGLGGCTANDNFWDTLKKRAILDEISMTHLRKDYI